MRYYDPVPKYYFEDSGIVFKKVPNSAYFRDPVLNLYYIINKIVKQIVRKFMLCKISFLVRIEALSYKFKCFLF